MDDSEWGDWKKSEVLKISDCDELTLKLDTDIQDSLKNDDDKQTILIVERINKLELDFTLAAANEGRVSLIIIVIKGWHFCLSNIYEFVINKISLVYQRHFSERHLYG